MSRMQEALSGRDYDYANPAVPVAVMLEVNTPDQSENRPHDTSQGRADRSRLSRSDILWIVRHSVRRDGRTGAGKGERQQQAKVATERNRKVRKRPPIPAVSVPHHGAGIVEPAEAKSVSLETQIRSFQERADLRECRLPGMLSKVSPKACEGWQRQATIRTSRIMANMKLDACKSCPYRLQEQAQV